VTRKCRFLLNDPPHGEGGGGGEGADHSPREGGIEMKGDGREGEGVLSNGMEGEWSPHTRARAP
jgi:hypothetical protein